MKMPLSVLCLAFAVLPAFGAEYFVAPDGSSQGDGSIDRPWDHLSALVSASDRIQPGDTVWLRSGTYRFAVSDLIRLRGAEGKPIILRNYNGERATLDGKVNLFDSTHLWVWGLEGIESTKASRIGTPQTFENIGGLFDRGGIGVRLINCVLHDLGIGSGNGPYEAYGNIIYYFGKDSAEHGLYWSNPTYESPASPRKVIENNLIGSGAGYAISVFGDNIRGFRIRGNATWNSGLLCQDWTNGEVLIGEGPSDDIVIEGNHFYQSPVSGTVLDLANGSVQNETITIVDNRMAGAQIVQWKHQWRNFIFTENLLYFRHIADPNQRVIYRHQEQPVARNIVIDRNTYYSDGGRDLTFAAIGAGNTLTFDQWKARTAYDANSVAVASATQPPDQVFVQPNKYEPGRGHVIIYNWSRQKTVEVDLSPLLRPGQFFRAHYAQGFYERPVIEDIYEGGAVSFPMTDLPMAKPVGFPQPPNTFPEFAAFVVLPGMQSRSLPGT